jgi:hypothetical protein
VEKHLVQELQGLLVLRVQQDLVALVPLVWMELLVPQVPQELLA